MMVEYGMTPLQVLKAATAINADVFELKQSGRIRVGFFADMIAVEGNPAENIHDIRNLRLVMKDGVVY
jgi:imidazolonepropionase-like amidohydrolase